MKDFFEDKEKRIPGNMEYDIEQIRNELGKGMNIEKIAEKLNLDQAYVEFLFWFGVLYKCETSFLMDCPVGDYP